MSQTDSGLTLATKPKNPSAALQLLLVLDIWVRTIIWTVAFAVTVLVMSRTAFVHSLSWDTLATRGGAWGFATTLMNFILLFNVVYILTLVVIRLPFPRPQCGVYRTGGSLNRSVIFSGLLATLTKARFQPPFPGIFVSQLANIMPFRWLLSRTIGPRTRSSFFVDPNIIDPWGVEIGQNVTLGFGSTIACHLQERDYIILDPVVIEDDVSIGAYAGIACGVHIKRGAVVEPYAAVKPRTIIGEYELWGGRPAFMKGTVRPARTAESRAAEPVAQT
ncbi:MAG TPA: DapH/DapD/GlmU-related protein [Phycisphaerae bacterium]|nr:DapH/DapD/GlmU-related protein [Phycisphaerae bacterium]